MVDLGQFRQVLLRIGRLGFLHCIGHGHQRIVGVRCVNHDILAVLLLVGRLEIFQALACRLFDAAGFRADYLVVAHAVAGQLRQVGSADGVAAHVLGLDAQLLHLAQHRAAAGVQAAEEHDIRFLGLERGQDRVEIGCLVVGVLCGDNRHAGSLGRLGEFFCQALAVGRTVVDYCSGLGMQCLGRVATQGAAQLAVVGDHAESRVVALLRVFGAGGRR